MTDQPTPAQAVKTVLIIEDKPGMPEVIGMSDFPCLPNYGDLIDWETGMEAYARRVNLNTGHYIAVILPDSEKNEWYRYLRLSAAYFWIERDTVYRLKSPELQLEIEPDNAA